MQRPGCDPWVGKLLWRREWQSTPVFLPKESHGQRSLAGYSLWGRQELDTTERLTHTHIHTHTHIPLPVEPPSHPTILPLCHHKAASRVRQQLLTSCLFYAWQCLHVSATVSIIPEVSLPCFMHKSTLYVCISVPSLQLGSSVPFF